MSQVRDTLPVVAGSVSSLSLANTLVRVVAVPFSIVYTPSYTAKMLSGGTGVAAVTCTISCVALLHKVGIAVAQRV